MAGVWSPCPLRVEGANNGNLRKRKVKKTLMQGVVRALQTHSASYSSYFFPVAFMSSYSFMTHSP